MRVSSSRSLSGDIDLAVTLRQVSALTCRSPLITAGHWGTDEYDFFLSLLLTSLIIQSLRC